ncbi:MAG: 3-phosphoshikimate 1-carboxyvinyltransferase [Clostridia bacterium]|nr:3-phosphoshikimate 1-carboxyvinyltransferase [Clostridia bacterium]
MNRTVTGTLSGTLSIMPSKSASHRTVLMASLSAGESIIEPLLLSQDISATLNCVKQLGLTKGVATMASDVPGFVRARILGRSRNEGKRIGRVLDCGESGSTLRFMIPLALDGRGAVRFTGRGRLMQRPLDVYETVLREQGILWQLRGNDLTVDGHLRPGDYTLPGDVSSQFITGLLLALPILPANSSIHLTTPLESGSYVELTRNVQEQFGVYSEWRDNGQTLIIPGKQQPRSPGNVYVEGDWSHAAFYLTAGALGGSGITLYGLDPNSTQGDKVILHFLHEMGAQIIMKDDTITVLPSSLHGITADTSQCPDLVPILAVAMAAAHGESRIIGAARLRLKESDRLRAMAVALQALKVICYEQDDGLIIRGGLPLQSGTVEGCNDHRVVMSMAIASALARGPVTITDSEAVAKSAPAFWEEFAHLGGIIHEG